MKNVSKFICVLMCSFTAFGILAAEADNFTRRDEKLLDMAGTINTKASDFLISAVDLTNTQSDCDNTPASEMKLYSNLKKYFANHNTGELSKYIIYGTEAVKSVIPLNESIYRQWTPLNGYLLGRKKAAESPLALAPLIRIGDQVVGTDKFEHMFGMGFKYFNNHYLEGKSMTAVIKNAVFLEKTALGGNFLATGVFSYGDLSANFNGMRFWNHILQKRDDILGNEYNAGPYVECKSNKYVVVKPIDFKNYIDHSMDESINCSKFATGKGLRKFKESLKRLGGFKCPMDPSLNLEMQKKYSVPLRGDHRTIADWIINKDSSERVSYFNEF